MFILLTTALKVIERLIKGIFILVNDFKDFMIIEISKSSVSFNTNKKFCFETCANKRFFNNAELLMTN